LDFADLLAPPAALHPIVVHFAIALTLFGVALDVAALWLGRSAWHVSARICLAWGVTAMLVSAGAGWFDHEQLHSSSGHSAASGELMELHETLGWALVGVFGLLGVARWRAGDRVPRALLALLAAAGLGLLVQGHIGGTLVFRHGLGVVEESETLHEPAAAAVHEHAGGHDHGGHIH